MKTCDDNNTTALAEALLDRHGTTFAEELGIDLTANDPSALFCWLCASILMSARISSEIAIRAARALAEAGWTTPQAMAASSRAERVKALNRSGYARYDESTARMLGEDAAILLEKYDGDLRNLREVAGRDPETEMKLLREFKGIGEVGASIFFREAQIAWNEFHPFADKKALSSAKKLGLPSAAAQLATLVERTEFPRLVAALVRCDLAGDHDAVIRAAGT